MQKVSSDFSDAELIDSYRNGDEQAFQVLVRRHLDGLFNFSFRYVSEVEAAEDIVQESFVKAWKNLAKFDDNNSFKTWLYAIAKNTAMDYLKKKKNLHFSDIQNIEDMVLEPVLVSTHRSNFAQIQSDNMDISRELEHLPQTDKAIMDMHYNQGYGFREIAEKLGHPINTIKTWHRRIIIRFKK